jgi:hypothetical protein
VTSVAASHSHLLHLEEQKDTGRLVVKREASPCSRRVLIEDSMTLECIFQSFLVAHSVIHLFRRSVPSHVKSKHVGAAFVPTNALQMSTMVPPETEVSHKRQLLVL